MKHQIKIVIIFLLCFLKSYSQQWEMTNLPYVYNDMFLDLYFGNADNGWFLVGYNGSSYPLKIYKTTNKGLNWNLQSEINDNKIYKYHRNGLFFINENTGWISYGAAPCDCAPTESFLYRTTNGGSSWILMNHNTSDAINGKIKFVDVNTGYLWDSYWNYNDTKLYKTTNSGVGWIEVYNTNNSNIIISDMDFSKLNNNSVFICGGTRDYLHPLMVKSNDGFATYTVIANGAGGDEIREIESISVSTGSNNQDILKFASRMGLGKLNSDNTLSIIAHPINENADVRRVIFTNENNGSAFVVYDQYYIYSTTDGGYNWNYSATMPSLNGFTWHFSNIGDIVSAPFSHNTGYHSHFIRKLNIAFNTNYDWRPNLYSGSILMDNKDNVGWRTFNTPIANQYLRGGSAELSIPTGSRYRISVNDDTTAQFYYWGSNFGNANGSMNPSNNNIYYTHDGDINADYKSTLVSTTNSAFKDANQVKALKDINGVTNILYEAMGGIFFSRTKVYENNEFKIDENLSGTAPNEPTYSYATFYNYNPYLAEIQKSSPNAIIGPEDNMAAVWERKEGNNIKIMFANRRAEVQYNEVKKHWYNEEKIALNNVPAGFMAYPKLLTYQDQTGGNWPRTRIIMYLKPVDAVNRKISVYGIVNSGPWQEYNYDLNIPPSDIKEYAIASNYPNKVYGYTDYSTFDVHIAYRVGQIIYYKRYKISPQYAEEISGSTAIVSNDDSRWRASLDIALRNATNDANNINMQPVITYQGQRNIIVKTRDVWGNPQELGAVYYPIFVREKLAGGSWNPVTIKYEQLNAIQQTPIIEGSKQNNSCLLNYTQNSTIHKQVVPRWNGAVQINTWYCSPNTFNGTDARLVKGSLINNGSTNHKLMTLTHPDATYLIGTQAFNITNNPLDPGIEAINGIVTDDNIKYSFNLGNIMVNWNTINLVNELDTAIEDGSEFNENFISKTFYLNDNDTLVISRNAFYVVDDPGVFHEYEYWVKLINKSTGEVQTLLANDTVQVGDTIQVEYLEGYIINNIPGGADSFYVQMEVDTLEADGGYGLGGDGGGDGGGDNINTIKQNVFWVGENIKIKNNPLPTVFNLYQNFPNPFNPVTKIKYDLPKNVNVTVKIYDLLGREVTTLVNNEFKNAGRYELEWNAQNYASGVYIYRIEAGDYVNVKKMILLK